MEAKRASAKSTKTERRVESSADENGEESNSETIENSGRNSMATAQVMISREAYADVSTQIRHAKGV
eukprot:1972796-Pleurochrysis_carterae.AAC.2